MDGMGGMQDGTILEEAQMGRAFDSGNKWHWDLISAWETNNPEKMQEAVAKNFDELKSVQMSGIAQLMLESLVSKKIRDLSATYLTLSFKEIAQMTKLPEETIEGSITKMVQQKAIGARINKK